MAKIDFNSIHSEKMNQYVELKRKLGYKFTTNIIYLNLLDRFIVSKNITEIGFTQAFADEWSVKQVNESESRRFIRISTLLHYSSYLLDIGISSYLPKLPKRHKSNFNPFIFSNAEMTLLFENSNKLIPGMNTSMSTSILAFPAILRVLYGTGIRIGEVLNIKISDLSIDEKYIQIKDIKNGKDRKIPISDSLLGVLITYINYRNKIPSYYTKSEYLFIKPDGNRCTDQGVRRWFKMCLKLSNISSEARIHDLRHTFAVNSLASMASAGIDLYVALPILSNYMGHQALNSTEYYVKLTINMFPQLNKMLEDVTIDIFPKYNNYE